MEENDRKKDTFESRIAPVLTYVGTIGAALMCIAYIVIVCVLIKGFKQEATLQITVFAIVNAAVGFCIMQFLKVQGVAFAKNKPENKVILNEYYNFTSKEKKEHSITFYWITSVIKDVLVKCLTLGASTIGVIYIVIEGNGDYALLGLAAVNLIMFICFGLLALNAAYEFYNTKHVPFIKKKLKELQLEKENSLTNDKVDCKKEE